MNRKWILWGSLALFIATVAVKPAVKSEWEDPIKSQEALDFALINLKSSPTEEHKKEVIDILEKIDHTIRKEVFLKKYDYANKFLLTYVKGLKSPEVVKKLEDLGATINWTNQNEAFAELDRLLFDGLKNTPASKERTNLENEIIAALGQIPADIVRNYYKLRDYEIEQPANQRIIDKFDEIGIVDWKNLDADSSFNFLSGLLKKATGAKDKSTEQTFYVNRFITLLEKVDKNTLPAVLIKTPSNKRSNLIAQAKDNSLNDIVDALIKKGAQEPKIDWSDETDVMLEFDSILSKKPELFTAALKNITSLPDPTIKNNLLLSILAMTIVAKKTQVIEEIEELIKAGVDINGIIPKAGVTPLISAVYESDGESSIVKFLLDKGAQVDKKDPDGKTALFYIDLKDPNNAAVQTLLEQAMAVEAQKNLQLLTSALAALK